LTAREKFYSIFTYRSILFCFKYELKVKLNESEPPLYLHLKKVKMLRFAGSSTSECFNGGSQTTSTSCSCPSGWNGTSCENGENNVQDIIVSRHGRRKDFFRGGIEDFSTGSQNDFSRRGSGGLKLPFNHSKPKIQLFC